MLLCNNGLFLPSLSISGGSIDYKGATIHRPSVILCVNCASFLACIRIELESWSLIGQSICDVRQLTRLYGLWMCGYWQMTDCVSPTICTRMRGRTSRRMLWCG